MRNWFFPSSSLLLAAILALGMMQCSAPQTKSNKEPSQALTTNTDTSSIVITDNTIQIFSEGVPIKWDEKSNCKIQFGKSKTQQNARLKFRGGASSKYHKHSFSIALSNDTLLNSKFHTDNDFILNASYIDKTFMRHRICYDLFQLFNDQNIVSQSTYKEVYLDGDYQGIYVLMEEIDRSKCNLSKADSSALLIKDGIMFVEDTAGFYTQKGEDLFQQKFPKEKTSTHFNRLSRLRDFIHFSSDQTFIDSVNIHFDLDNISDWHLLLLFSNNGDGVVKNFYWYTGNNEPWRVIPWDYDDSFGRNGDGTINTTRSGWERNILLKRLFDLNPNEYRDTLIMKIKEFNQLIKFDSSKTFISYMEDLILGYDELQPAAFERNFDKWSINDVNYADSMNRQQEIELLQNNWSEQIKFLDSLSITWETL